MSRVIVEDFAGPGGWDEGARLIGVGGIVGYEKDEAACATAEAAGHHRVRGDVQDVQRGSETPPWGYIASPPCQAWSTAGKRQGILDQSAIFAHLDAVISAGEWVDYPRDGWHDDRSPLVLEVVRAVLQLRPTWIALEQVPGVLPFWERLTAFLRTLGYRAWCGILDAEMYGVPQTRDRAILTASLDPAHSISRPPATHERYRFDTEAPADLFGELLPCVSMAQALGWGMTERPSITVTAGGGRQGGPDPLDGGSGARRTLKNAREQGTWVARRPATTICGDSRVFQPGGHHTPGAQSENSIRVSVDEAAVLQSFRVGYPWQGKLTKQFEQIGNAVPPLLSAAVLGHTLNVAGWQDVCRGRFAERAA